MSGYDYVPYHDAKAGESTTTWYEVRMREGALPDLVYHALNGNTDAVMSYHHFWDEPWWPNRYVVRIEAVRGGALLRDAIADIHGVDHVTDWDPTSDEAAYGNNWPWVRYFFYASVGAQGNFGMKAKMVHCYLNSQGMGPWSEAWFALRFAFNRMTIGLRWRLYLRRQWLAENPWAVEAAKHSASRSG